MKKLVVIIIVGVIIIAIAVGVYFGYQKSKGTVSPGETQSGSSLPIGAGSGGSGGGIAGGATGMPSGAATSSEDVNYYADQKQRLSIMTTQAPVGYWFTLSKSTTTPSQLFYVDQKGEVVQVTDPGKENVVASSSFGAPLSVTQNIDGSKVAIFFDSGTVAIYDTVSKVWQALDPAIKSLAFSPDGKSIVFLKPDGSQTGIYTQNISAAKKSVTLISSLNIQDFSVAWPSVNILVLMPKPANGIYNDVWYFDLKNKTINSFGSNAGLEYDFSQKSNFALQFVASDRSKIAVSIDDGLGKKLADMPFSTIAEKCSFAQDSSTAYCAIPVSFTADNPVLPDDYLKQSVFTTDVVYKIDMASSMISKVIDSGTANIDAINLAASSSTLYFINRLDGLLYRFNL